MFGYPDNLLGLILTCLTIIVPLMTAITFHEVAHGWVAYRCGDSTAKMLGRLSLNPIKHLDPVGSVLVPAATYWLGGMLFGWAKPVPVNFYQLKHPKRDTILVALAGPFANLLMAIFWLTILKLAPLINAEPWGNFVGTISLLGAWLNAILMLFNLLPIPPLDGSRVIAALLPKHWQAHYETMAPYSMLILIALIASKLLPLAFLFRLARDLLQLLSSF